MAERDPNPKRTNRRARHRGPTALARRGLATISIATRPSFIGKSMSSGTSRIARLADPRPSATRAQLARVRPATAECRRIGRGAPFRGAPPARGLCRGLGDRGVKGFAGGYEARPRHLKNVIGPYPVPRSQRDATSDAARCHKTLPSRPEAACGSSSRRDSTASSVGTGDRGKELCPVTIDALRYPPLNANVTSSGKLIAFF